MARPQFSRCPNGTKLWLLNFGTIVLDDQFVLSNSQGIGKGSNPQPEHRQVELIVYGVLIEHPEAGLILFETGIQEDMETEWGAGYDYSPRKNYTQKNKLDEQIALTGHDIKDIKAVIIGHLHADHGGGLEHFVGTQVPIYVHEEELRNALWCLYNKMDSGLYQKGYLKPELNWRTFQNRTTELFKGITMHHCPGHTPGLSCMQVDLENFGTFLFTGDQFHVKENYLDEVPQGLLSRDRNDWLRSLRYIQRLVAVTDAKLMYGHDFGEFFKMKQNPEFYN